MSAVSKVDSTANAYESLNKVNEYLDLSCRNMGKMGVFRILEDIEGDRMIRQLNLSYNISLEEVGVPAEAEGILKKIEKHLRENRHLTALDFAGNHTFHYFPHPENEHTTNYVIALTKVLRKTKISHLDISDNFVTGKASRELKGLTYMMEKYMIHGKAFKCRFNYLNSQGFRCISNCLGIRSTLTYLDVSDNFGGLDPFGNPSRDGADALAQVIPQSQQLRVLKLARNFLNDTSIVTIVESLHDLPQFQGHYCYFYA